MLNSFLHLEAREQSQIYHTLAQKLSRSAIVLEKDVWVCWVLQALFTMPEKLPMAFKGGTSLSKVFKAIDRFSEDVDITLDYRGLDASFDPFAAGVSGTRLKKFSEKLKSFVRDYIYDIVRPHFQKKLAAEFIDSDSFLLDIGGDDGEQLRLYYPTVLDASEGYVGNSILIEFGGRNITEPNEEHEVRPDIAEHITELAFPHSKVNVLSPARTFLEKATLIHAECQRQVFRSSLKRLSRHWYDLAMLADLPYGQAALTDWDLFAAVVKHKKTFYKASHANYDACLIGQLRLVPDDEALAALHDDFQQMIDAGMFIGEVPAFNAIVHRLRALEAQINR